MSEAHADTVAKLESEIDSLVKKRAQTGGHSRRERINKQIENRSRFLRVLLLWRETQCLST